MHVLSVVTTICVFSLMTSSNNNSTVLATTTIAFNTTSLLLLCSLCQIYKLLTATHENLGEQVGSWSMTCLQKIIVNCEQNKQKLYKLSSPWNWNLEWPSRSLNIHLTIQWIIQYCYTFCKLIFVDSRFIKSFQPQTTTALCKSNINTMVTVYVSYTKTPV